MLKIRPAYIFLIIVVVLISLGYYLQEKTVESAGKKPKATTKPEKITAFDSLLIDYDSLISAEVESNGSVGAAVAVTYRGEVVYMKCFGVKKAGEKDSVDTRTVFRLASVSKPISGVLAGILADEDIIGLDEKVIDYIPDFRLRDTLNTNHLSIRNLLSHTSGLVPHAYDNLVEANVNMGEILDSLFRVNISGPPGLLYGYQNVIFSLLDTIAAVKTSKSFDRLLKEKVFIPFGMDRASTGFRVFEEGNNVAYPHSKFRGSYVVLRLNDRYYNTIPAAGINASINDLAHLLLAFSPKSERGIKQEVADTILKPQVVSPLRWNYLRKWDEVESKHYALGWRIIGYKDHTIAYHGGYVQGYRADIALCREEDFGIAFLTNSPNGTASTSIPAFLDLYFERMEKN